MRRLGIVLVVIVGALWPAAALGAVSPMLIGSISNSTTVSGADAVAVSGSHAYTTAYWPGELTAVDFSDPTAPFVAGFTPATGSLENGANVMIAGNDAFVVSKNRNLSSSSNDDGSGNSLTVVNISDPSSPSVLGTVHDPLQLFGAYGIAVQSHYAYIAAQGLLGGQPGAPDTSTGAFAVIDLNNLPGGVIGHLDNSSLPGSWAGSNVLHHPTSVAISGHYAFVTSFYPPGIGVTVIDISNPQNPVIVRSLTDAAHLPDPVDLAVQGGYLYAVNQVDLQNQFTVIDISIPASPSVVGSLNSSALEGAYRIRVRGGFAYVAASDASAVAEIDISNPAAPQLAGSVIDGRLTVTTGLDIDPSGSYVIAVSPRASGQPSVKFPPYPGQSGPANTGTISVIDLDPAAPADATPPTVSGGPTLTAAPGSWTGSPPPFFSYQWSRCDAGGRNCALTPGATAQTYTPGPGDVGSTFTVLVTASNLLGSASASAPTTPPITGAPVVQKPPGVSGAIKVGAQLTGTNGSWSAYPSPTFSASWLRCDAQGGHCQAIRRQTKARYKIAAADIGFTLRYDVTATNQAGSASAASSPSHRVAAPRRPTLARTRHATLTGLSRGRPRLQITISGAPGDSRLTRVTISLPRGLGFSTSARELAHGITVTGLRKTRQRFSAKIVSGALVLTLPRATLSLRAQIGPRALRVSRQLALSVRRRHTRTLRLNLALSGPGAATVRARLRVSVA